MSSLGKDRISMSQVIQNIMGYSSQIETPFGKICSVYADHTATGRPFKMIEDIIQNKVKPLIANSHTAISHMGSFSTKLLKYSEYSILKSFGVSDHTHFAIPAGSGCTGAFERLHRILRLHEIVQKNNDKMEINTFSTGNLDYQEDQEDYLPLVYLTPYEHHTNILPWITAGCIVKPIDSDSYGNLDLIKFKEELQQNQQKQFIIISVSATSNVTSQQTNLQQLNQIVAQYRRQYKPKTQSLLFVVDVAAYVSHNKLDLSTNGFPEIDYVCISPHKMLGGSESTGVLIGKKEAYDSSNPPSFPGGGTVTAVVSMDADHIWFEPEPSVRETPGTPNMIGFYRAALAFELQDLIGINIIKEREEKNAKYFFDKIQQFNKEQLANLVSPRCIKIYGDPNINCRFDIFSFNIYGPGSMIDFEGQQLFHPHFVSQICNDIFGIQVRSGCSCAGPYGVQLLKINLQTAEEIVKQILEGKEETKPGWVRLDTFFTFEKYELDYIISALTLIALHGENILQFYSQQKTGVFVLDQYYKKSEDLSLSIQDYFQNLLIDDKISRIEQIPILERPQILEQQLKKGKEIIKNPQQFFKSQQQEKQILIVNMNNNENNLKEIQASDKDTQPSDDEKNNSLDKNKLI